MIVRQDFVMQICRRNFILRTRNPDARLIINHFLSNLQNNFDAIIIQFADTQVEIMYLNMV